MFNVFGGCQLHTFSCICSAAGIKGSNMKMHLHGVRRGWTHVTQYLLIPRPSLRSRRGSGVLSNISCHMGWGHSYLVKQSNNLFIFLNWDLEFLMPQCIGTTIYKSLRKPHSRTVETERKFSLPWIWFKIRSLTSSKCTFKSTAIWLVILNLWQEMLLRAPDPLHAHGGSRHKTN